MLELTYPFDSLYILRKRKSLRKALLMQAETNRKPLLHKKIAILGGSTTHDIRDILDLFLLDEGLQADFYESEYAQWWNDAMFGTEELDSFAPDIVFIHTSTRNVSHFPSVRDTSEQVETLLEEVYGRFEQAWEKITEKYHCPIIQNNFEQPFWRLLGNSDVTDLHGRLNFMARLNQKFYAYAQSHKDFHIHDINYLASCYGLQRWADPSYWYQYKYALAVDAIPEFAYNLSHIIKSLYGKNKKAFVLDLDNTLWGGVVGDDGADGIEIGQETAVGELYAEFQGYIKSHKDLGILLTVDSKNDEENAIAGLNRPDGVLHPGDFTVIKANWVPKDRNLLEIACELDIGADSLVFVDDNPAERAIVRQNGMGAAVPEIGMPGNYINVLDRTGYFEVTSLSEDDLARTEMYRANIERRRQQTSFSSYEDYLRSLEMVAEIKPFSSAYMSRIAQLTNKSNQFNLTTLRCTLSDIERIASDRNYITLYGKLGDKFGDNGVVSVVFGHLDIDDASLFHIDLWLMSCRVLKRGMEDAMLDELVRKCRCCGVKCLQGYYYPTAKNKMVKDFYGMQGFKKLVEDTNGNSSWKLSIDENYKNRNKIIIIESNAEKEV